MLQRMQRRLVRITLPAVFGLALIGAAVPMTTAPANAVTGCYRTSDHAGYPTYNCYMYRSSVHLWNHWSTALEYNLADNQTGILYQGTSWFVCQRTHPVDIYYGNAVNNWWAYTLGDNGWWGWVNAVYISGGANWGPVPGLAVCPGGFGDSTWYPGDRPGCGRLNIGTIDGSHKTVFEPRAIMRFGVGC